jgi:hypothetical protein
MAVKVWPPSVDFHTTMAPVNTISGLWGWTLTSAKSEPRCVTRESSLVRYQLSPASSERYSPPFCRDSTVANMRLGMLGATVMPMRLRPCSSKVGNPSVKRRHVSPPSVDLNIPLPGPRNTPFSHGPSRASHITAYTVCASLGSKATSTPPVFSSR